MVKTSPLDEQHRRLGAKMGAFGGWDMPISYTGTIAEHTATREHAGIFDVSHLGKVMVRGDDAASFLDSQLTNRMDNLAPGRARYTLVCNDDGGILDDLIVYAIAPGEMLVVPNASNRDAVVERLQAAAPSNVEVEVLDWTTIAVQGPASREIVARHFPEAKELAYMRTVRTGDVIVSRSGYTGEVGYEVFTTTKDGAGVWRDLLDDVRRAGGEPCGLAARDTLRLEMGYPLHGNDIDPATTPAEAGLMWAVALEGRAFPGHGNVGRRSKQLVGLLMQDKLIPRRHCAVLALDDEVGEVTSGTFSPTLKQGIAMATVRPDSIGSECDVDVRGKRGHARVVKPPFVDRSPK